MAVTKIRKISSWTLLVCTIFTLVVVAFFCFGGVNEPLGGKMWYPRFTELALSWMYVIFGITLIATLFFAFWQFVSSFRADARKALVSLGILVLFVLVFVITYVIGDGTLIDKLGRSAATASYNTAGWLKTADMLLYTAYFLFIVTIVAIVAGSVKKILRK